MFVMITVSLLRTGFKVSLPNKFSCQELKEFRLIYVYTEQTSFQSLAVDVSPATSIRLPKPLLFLVEFLIKTVQVPLAIFVNGYAVNSFLQYCPKFVELFGTTACNTTAATKTFAMKSGLTMDVSNISSYLTYQLNTFRHKLSMIGGKHDFYGKRILLFKISFTVLTCNI